MWANRDIVIIGLGYVGLPLASLLATKNRVIGFDINVERVNALKNGLDITGEVLPSEFAVENLLFTSNLVDITDKAVYIITVPTPVMDDKLPDLRPIVGATDMVARIMAKGALVIYESTVYPGLTETVCRRVIEDANRWKYNSDFFLGYSPERVNPGDKIHTVKTIVKLVAGSTKEVTAYMEELYGNVVLGGVKIVSTIRVAEASKIIENVQRDVNIALFNELALIFDSLGIDSQEVFNAAATKWNFHRYSPGLVGGHCIAVDPYYLINLANTMGVKSGLMETAREVNESITPYLVKKIINYMGGRKNRVVSILGVAFKENVPDFRNSKVIDLFYGLKSILNPPEVYVCDPVLWSQRDAIAKNCRVELVKWENLQKSDVIVLAVKHDEFKEIPELVKKLKPGGWILDLKRMLPANFKYRNVWRL